MVLQFAGACLVVTMLISIATLPLNHERTPLRKVAPAVALSGCVGQAVFITFFGAKPNTMIDAVLGSLLFLSVVYVSFIVWQHLPAKFRTWLMTPRPPKNAR